MHDTGDKKQEKNVYSTCKINESLLCLSICDLKVSVTKAWRKIAWRRAIQDAGDRRQEARKKSLLKL